MLEKRQIQERSLENSFEEYVDIVYFSMTNFPAADEIVFDDHDGEL